MDLHFITGWDYYNLKSNLPQLDLKTQSNNELNPWPILKNLYTFNTHKWFKPGTVTQLCGLSGSGKTQLIMLIAISVALPPHMGGMDGEVILIDTEGGILLERFVELICISFNDHVAANKDTSIDREMFVKLILSKISLIRISEIQDLLQALKDLEPFIKKHVNTRLLCIDTLAFPLRQLPIISKGDSEPFVGYDRISSSYACMDLLTLLANSFGLIVIFSNHMVLSRSKDHGGLEPLFLGSKWNFDTIFLSWDYSSYFSGVVSADSSHPGASIRNAEYVRSPSKNGHHNTNTRPLASAHWKIPKK
jgi:hypothetical protein